MSNPKRRHPADEPIPGEFLSNADSVPGVHVDKPVTDSKVEDVKPNAGSAAVPCFEEPPAPKGRQLEGSDPKRSGAGSEKKSPPPEAVDGF